MLIMPISNSTPLSASSIEGGVSGRNNHWQEPDEPAFGFGNQLTREMEERETSGAGSGVSEKASSVDRPASEGHVNLGSEASGAEGGGVDRAGNSSGRGAESRESLEETSDIIDIAALAGMPPQAANVAPILQDIKAGLIPAWQSAAPGRTADRFSGETQDSEWRSMGVGRIPGEGMAVQWGRANSAGPAIISSSVEPAGIGTAAAAAGIAEKAGTFSHTSATEGGRSLRTPDFSNPVIGIPGTHLVKGIAGDAGNAEIAASLLEMGLWELSPTGIAGSGRSNMKPMIEDGPAASLPGMPVFFGAGIEGVFAISTGNPSGVPGLEPRIGSPGWDHALGQKVLWLVSQQQQVAELNLNPPDLGPLQIVLKMADDQLSATFVSQQADVRNALEAALPRLKDMMSESGINLSSTMVSSDSSPGQRGFERPNHADGLYLGGEGHRTGPESGFSDDPGKKGLVDTFA